MKKHKTGLIFALVMVASGLVGGVASILAIKNIDSLLSLGLTLETGLKTIAPWALGMLLALQLGWGTKLLLSARRAVGRALAQPEEDALLDEADRLCDRGVGFLSLCNILAYLSFGLGTVGLRTEGVTLWGIGLLLVLFLGQMFSSVFYSARFVRLTGQLYPEKQANVLSMNFHKEWFASCDEAERLLIGQAAYRAMRAGQGACLGAWLAVTLLGMYFNIGVLPLLTVAAVMLTMNISYLRACRLCKRLAA